ncbi:MAG: Rne/Rng family ribonuclease [Aquificae bacterium]|nr:Rne/Rng family ribonuclease [Aquificota bacterium]
MLGEVDIFISANESLVFTFVVSGEDIVELKVERRGRRSQTGSIFKGIVKNVCNSLDGYFVDIGTEKEAFLQDRKHCEGLKVGDKVIVQLRREDTPLKGAKLTCKVALPGKYIIYFPTLKKLKASGKIKNIPFTERLKEVLRASLNSSEGVIIRASAVRVSEREVLEELEKLRKLWEGIKEKAKRVQKGLLYEDLPAFARVIRDYWSFIREICVDNAEIWKELINIFGDTIKTKLRYTQNLDKLGKLSVYQLISRLFMKHVWLQGGGFIVIEPTEAMVVIDVNTGEGCGHSLEDSALRTNIKALKVIAKQIKLRNLSGIIVIDLVDLKREEDKRRVLEEAKRIFEKENLRAKVYDITRLGLMEITRKRDSESVYEVLGESCPACNGTGIVRSKDYVLYLIEKELEQNKWKRAEIRVHPRLAEDVRRLIRKKKLQDWITIKEVWTEKPDFFTILFTDY